MSTKDARVNVRIEGEMEEWMKEVAKAEGISVSAVARRILINILMGMAGSSKRRQADDLTRAQAISDKVDQLTNALQRDMAAVDIVHGAEAYAIMERYLVWLKACEDAAPKLRRLDRIVYDRPTWGALIDSPPLWYALISMNRQDEAGDFIRRLKKMGHHDPDGKWQSALESASIP